VTCVLQLRSVRYASSLVLAEHSNSAISSGTLSAITAARKLGDVVVLVAGSGCDGAANAAASAEGVTKVLVADNPAFAGGLAESTAQLMAGVQDKHSACPL
jgi:electron transfer flavoprotein alpha subunit